MKEMSCKGYDKQEAFFEVENDRSMRYPAIG